MKHCIGPIMVGTTIMFLVGSCTYLAGEEMKAETEKLSACVSSGGEWVSGWAGKECVRKD